jgi:hypothetical protein
MRNRTEHDEFPHQIPMTELGVMQRSTFLSSPKVWEQRDLDAKT